MSSTSSSSQTKIQAQQKIAAKENPSHKENKENNELTTSGAPATTQTRRSSNRTMDVNPTVPTSKNTQRSLIPSSAPSAPSASPSSSSSTSSSEENVSSKSSQESDGNKGDKKQLKSSAVFAAIQKRINADTVNKVKAVYRFDITPDSPTGDDNDNNTSNKNASNQQPESWLIELKEGNGKVRQADANSPADCTIAMKDSDFVSLMTGKMNAQAAFMKGKLKVRGNIMLAQKLSALMPQPKPKSKL